MTISLEQLKAFVATAEAGSFSAAARKLGKAQSSISELVNALEIAWNVELFDRSQRTAKLTDAGQALLRDAQLITRDLHNLNAKAESLSEGNEGIVRLAYEEASIPQPLLRDILKDFETRFPFVQLELLRAASDDIMDLVCEGRVDIGVMFFREASPDGVEYQSAGHIGQIRIAGKEHPLSQLECVTRDDLHCHRKVYRTSHILSQVTEHKDITANIWYTDSYKTIVDLVKENLGWSIIPKHLVEQELKEGSIVELPCEDQTIAFVVNVDCVWTRTRLLGRAGNWLREQLSDWPEIEQ